MGNEKVMDRSFHFIEQDLVKRSQQKYLVSSVLVIMLGTRVEPFSFSLLGLSLVCVVNVTS